MPAHTLTNDTPSLRRYPVTATYGPSGWVLSTPATRAVLLVADRADIPRAARDLIARTTGVPAWQVHADVTIRD